MNAAWRSAVSYFVDGFLLECLQHADATELTPPGQAAMLDELTGWSSRNKEPGRLIRLISGVQRGPNRAKSVKTGGLGSLLFSEVGGV